MDAINSISSNIFPENLKLGDMPYLCPYPVEECKLVNTAAYGTQLLAYVRDPKDNEKRYTVWLPRRAGRRTTQDMVDEINAEPSVFLVHTGTKRARNPQFDSELFQFIRQPGDVQKIVLESGVYQEKRRENQ